MADLALNCRGKLAKGRFITARNKDGIITETALAARFRGDNAVADTFRFVDHVSLRIGNGNMAHEAGPTVFTADLSKLVKDDRHFGCEIRFLASIASRQDAGAAAEGVDLKPGIVRDGREGC